MYITFVPPGTWNIYFFVHKIMDRVLSTYSVPTPCAGDSEHFVVPLVPEHTEHFVFCFLGAVPCDRSGIIPRFLWMAGKREFSEFTRHTNVGTLGWQRGFRKTQVVGSGPRISQPSMPPRRGKVMMVATRSRPVTHRVKGKSIQGPRRVFRPQGLGPRTGGFTGIERKFYDTHLSLAALTAPTDSAGGEHNPSATICLNSIVQGDGEEQRDGRKATIQSCYVNGIIACSPQINQTALDAALKVYVALVLDTQTNGALLNSEDVFKNESADALLASSPMRNMQFTQRFRILDTAVMDIPFPQAAYDGTNLEQAGSVTSFRLSSNMTFNTLYSGTTESIANITDNSLSIIAFSSDVGLVPSIAYNARVRFVG